MLLSLILIAGAAVALARTMAKQLTPQPVYCRLSRVSINCRPTPPPFN